MRKNLTIDKRYCTFALKLSNEKRNEQSESIRRIKGFQES